MRLCYEVMFFRFNFRIYSKFVQNSVFTQRVSPLFQQAVLLRRQFYVSQVSLTFIKLLLSKENGNASSDKRSTFK